MAWDDFTLESPSFNGTNAGTMIRLPVQAWAHALRDANPPASPVGEDEAPVKVDVGAFTETFVLSGQITTKSATDTNIWNATIIEGASRTALDSSLEFRDLLRKAKTEWWSETGSGNWHNDGTPARATGLCRIRTGNKWSGGAAVAYYTYGHVVDVEFGTITSSMKEGLIIPWKVTFGYAQIESV